MSTVPDAAEEARRVIGLAAERGLPLRLIGGLAVRLHCESAGHRALARHYPDLDVVCPKGRGAQVEAVMAEAGYVPNKTFNLLNGSTRMLFFDEANERQVDVFVGEFQMCHHLQFSAERLAQDPLTVPLAELLLSKLQVVRLNEKDVRDLCALLLDHPLGEGDAETINLPVIVGLCAEDWGWWKTVNVTLDRLKTISADFDLEPERRERLLAQLETLRQALEAAPKSLKWKVRARVGERLTWYELPEEVKRG